jgi:hypothetical protein
MLVIVVTLICKHSQHLHTCMLPSPQLAVLPPGVPAANRAVLCSSIADGRIVLRRKPAKLPPPKTGEGGGEQERRCCGISWCTRGGEPPSFMCARLLPNNGDVARCSVLCARLLPKDGDVARSSDVRTATCFSASALRVYVCTQVRQHAAECSRGSTGCSMHTLQQVKC